MIERISELPLFGPEEQLRKFICQTDESNRLDTDTVEGQYLIHDNHAPENCTATSQKAITQNRISNIDDILQKQFIWSYAYPSAGDAYFYWDWCPSGNEGDNTKWQIVDGDEFQDNLDRDIDRSFDYTTFKGFKSSTTSDQMPTAYDATTDEHASDSDNIPIDLEINTLMHNMMRGYIEVSEWLGDSAAEYGSHNGYVSRKMSMCWLFDAIRALINFKLANQDKYAEETIYTLQTTGQHKERFLQSGERTELGEEYTDHTDLAYTSENLGNQIKQRSRHPNTNGILKVRGNEWHYGERGYFYTHNSFMGECRFYHNVRFLGQTTFDKEINGTAMRSRWGDLSEMYESDSQYEFGTLVMFGGDKEITKSNGKVCNAIITSKPGLILNGDNNTDKLMLGIALVGRVPVKVSGKVKKFDKLVPDSSKPGYARSKKWYDWFKSTLGVALEDGNDSNVECSVKINFD